MKIPPIKLNQSQKVTSKIFGKFVLVNNKIIHPEGFMS